LFFKDADEVAKQIVEPGQPAFNEIKETFGQSVIDELTGKIVSSFFWATQAMPALRVPANMT
jgi:dephospho-CoA kinase